MLRSIALTLILLSISSLVLSEADGPDSWMVVKIGARSGLNLRYEPTTDSEVLLVIPHDAVDLQNLGCRPEYTTKEWLEFTETQRKKAITDVWSRVRYNNIVGWVYAFYIDEY